MTVQEKRAEALELLDKYAETQDKLQSYIIKSEIRNYEASSTVPGTLSYVSGREAGGALAEVRFDGRRACKRGRKWGHVGLSLHFTPKEQAQYRSFLWDGRVFFRHNYPCRTNERFGSVFIDEYRGRPQEGQQHVDLTYSLLGGFFYCDFERIDSILRRIEAISMRDRMERIGESYCYVIDAKGKQGAYTIWIDPEHGYNIAQAVTQKVRGNLVRSRPLIDHQAAYCSLTNVRFRQIDGLWVPVEADRVHNQTLPNGTSFTESDHIKRTEIILNPDHDALGSFVPSDIRNGATVEIRDLDGEYIWQDGKVVDEQGRTVDIAKLGKRNAGTQETKKKQR